MPHLGALRAQDRDVRQELERALRGIGRPALYVVDNIPEPAAGKDPPSIGEFCPALGAVTVLATSRHDTRESNVQTIPVDALTPEAATLAVDGKRAGCRHADLEGVGASCRVGGLPAIGTRSAEPFAPAAVDLCTRSAEEGHYS